MGNTSPVPMQIIINLGWFRGEKMAETQGDQIQFLLSDFNTRLRDIDERNRLVRERVLVLGKNVLASRQEIEDMLKELHTQNLQMKAELDKLKRLCNNLLLESGRAVKQEEIMVIERMLKDFQPMEFMRKKDVEELLERRLEEKTKHIKSTEA
jgi:hypothetical protein